MSATSSGAADSDDVEALALEVAKRLGRSLETLSEEELLAQLEILLGGDGERVEDEIADPIESFEARARQSPLAPALIEAAAPAGALGQLTYAQLDARANRLAHHLREHGVAAGNVVGVDIHAPLERATAVIALLKLGAVYTPLACGIPVQHHRRLLQLAGASRVLSMAGQEVAAFGPERIELPRGFDWAAHEAPAPALAPRDPNAPAYVVDVSGRALVVERAALAHALGWLQARVALSPSDRVLGTASPGVDVALWELLWPLARGALCVLGASAQPLGANVFDAITRHRIGVLRVSPAGLRSLIAGALAAGAPDWGPLRHVVCSGGPLPPSIVRDFQARPGATLHSVYAPPGAGGGVSERVCEPGQGASGSPLGRACGRRSLYALNDRLQPVPPGVFAEIWVAGEPLARGYLNDAAATQQRFVADPFGASERRGRLFRTGDRGRRLRDGSFELAARGGSQLWKEDHCIELGWVAEQMRALPDVAECVVLDHESATAEVELIAHVASRGAIGEAALIEQARRCLPAAFLPARVVLWSELPKARGGRVDEKALRRAPRSERVITPPRNALEQRWVALWREVLGIEHVGVDERFFDLGGDSATAMQLMAAASRAGLRLTLEAVFRHPTIAELALLGLDQRAVNAEQGRVSGAAPLTAAQRFFFSHDMPAPHHFNHAYSFEAREPLELARFERALHAIVEQHDALRARFVQRDGRWWQWLAEDEPSVIAERLDLSALPEAKRAAAFEARATALQASLDLERGPLLKVLIGEPGGERRARVLVIIHHLVVDGLSWGILLEDLQAVYAQLGRGEPIRLPAKTTSFKHWAERVAAYAATPRQAALDYWTARSWPRDSGVPRDLGGPNREGTADNVSIGFGARDTEVLLKQVTQAFGVSVTEAMLASLARSIAHSTGSRRVLLEVSHHGRKELSDEVDLSRTVGWFSTLYPVLLDLGDDPDPVRELRAVAAQLRAVPEHGFDFFLSRFMPGDGGAVAPLAAIPRPSILLNYWGPFGSASGSGLLELVGSSVGPIHDPRGTRMYELVYNQFVADGELALGLTYSAELHRRSRVERLAHSYFDALRALVHAVGTASRGSENV